MAVSIPPVLVLFVCKVALVGVPDVNSGYTGALPLEWATENSMMICRRHEVQMFDPAEAQGAAPLEPNFANQTQCARAAMMLGMDWDMKHLKSNWRVWKVGCPAPIIDIKTGAVIGYKLPECNHRDTVICETDSAI